MKARINYKSRQTIIIMSIAVVLLIAAITGTVAFVKGNRNVAAAMNDENRQTVENSEDNNSRTNISIADNGNLNSNGTENNSDNGKVLPNTGDNANPIDIGQNGNNGENNGATIENDGTKVADTGNTPSTTNENGSVAGNSSSNNSLENSTSGNQNGNTSTSTTTGEANVPNQEYTQTTVIPGRENVLVEQNTEIGWSPISIKAFDIATKLKVHVNKFPDINTIKTSEGKHKDGTPVTKENPLHELDTITYTLTVKNIGNGKGTVKISDTVPEGTTLVTDSIKCGENTYTEAELNAGIEVSLEGGEEKYITFTVIINPFEDEKITVRNAEAKQDENPVPPTDDEVVKEYVSIDVNKEFIDKENVEELRPTDVVVALYERENDETYIDTRTLNEQNGWKESFTGLDKYDSDTKELINYDVRELDINENYTASYDKNQEQNNITLKITNTLKYENISTSVTVNKIWIDPENIVRPEVTINLYQNGSEDVFASYTLKNGETSHEFTNLPKYDDDGNEYVYTADEAEVNGYTAEYSNDTLTITNTIDQENTVSISGTKTWVDPEGIEHPTIKINLFQNEQLYDSVKLENGTTSYLFSNLPKYRVDENGKYELDENGRVQLNEYTVEEENVEGYTPTYSGEYNEKITNTINQEKLTISGTKTWIDPQGTVHKDVIIDLIRDNEKINSVTLTNGTTSYEFKDLDKYAPDGHIYKYTIVEENAEGYTPSYSGEYNEKITNTINQDNTVSVTGIKNWVDPQGTEHPEITIRLIRDDVQTEKFVTLKNGEKDYSFTGLEKYAPDGHIYKYTVKEDKVDGYETDYGENIITNTINQEKVTINGTKTWVDPKETVHSEITINLMRDNIKFDTVKLSNGTTSYEFKNLDKYAPDGHIYNYTIVEENVEGYTPSYSGEYNENITNTINQEKIAVNGEKKWIAPVGTTSPTITIRLFKDGTEINSKELPNGTTSYLFDKLDKYDLTDGHEYVYTVTEDKVDGYKSEQNGNNFINTINQELISINGEKTWVDPEGTELVHPEITINLLKNGIKDKTIKLTNGNTKYEFTGLPKYQVNEDGSYILDNNGNVQLNQYRVEEEVVQNYATSYDGYNITNTFKQDIQGTVEITTTKTSETSVKTPLDVVFVLDVSGSMNDNDKDKTMVDSVNSAISTIMQENPDSRVGVVAYSSKENSNYSNNSNAITLLPLGKYTPKSDGKYLTIKDDTYTITWRDEWGIPQSATYDKDIISTNVNEVASISLNVYGGTYTQTGIKAGADILTSASTKYTTKVNGKDKEVMRTPVIILLSDGDPTYYNKNYQSLTGDRSGTGNSTLENDAYYTIRTADYYKKQVTSHYYGTTGTKSKFYTIGLNMSGTLSKTILDPSADNLNECNKNGGNLRNRNVMGKLYDKIISDGSADKYSYADKSYVGSMTASDLQGIFNTIINDSTTSTEKRDITLEESNNRRVDLEGIDTSKAFRLIIGNTSYNFAQAKASDYVKGNDTDGYYVDLSKVAKGSTITISYNK